MANSQISQEDFIDLYDALNLPQDADIEKVRKRINVLYLESQQNLDHRNPKKRLQYQQLYEITLPQARHLLLDEGRRAEYDRYLTAFKTGTKVSATQDANEHYISTSKRSTVTERLKEEEGVDPEKLAEQREDMWAQWKHGLEQVANEPEPVQETDSSVPNAAATLPERSPELRRATLEGEQPAEIHRGFSKAALRAGESQSAPIDKRELQQRRIKFINRRARNVMLPRGLIVGVLVLVVSLVVLYYAKNYLISSGYLKGTVEEIVNWGWIPLAIIIAAVQGRNAALSARQSTIDKLSKLSLEELRQKQY